MRTRLIRFVVLSLLVTSGGAAFAKGPITLELKPKVGSAYTMKVKIEQNIKLVDDTAKFGITQEMFFVFGMQIIDRFQNGNVGMNTSYERAAMTQLMQLQDTAIRTTADTQDSTKFEGKNAPKLLEALSKLIGIHFYTESTKLGSTVRSNLDSVLASTGVSDPGASAGNGEFSATFPNHPVKVGETWHSTVIKPTKGGELRTETDYTLTDAGNVENPFVEVGFHATLSATMSAGTMTGKMVGTFTIDRSTGWTKHGSISQDADVTANGEKMKVLSEISVSSTLKE